MKSIPIIGASFSQHHLNHLGISSKDALDEYANLGFRWIRLGCYWSQIETSSGVYNFNELDMLVEQCEKQDIQIVMTIGMKAPRWPEFYIPAWLKAAPSNTRIIDPLCTFITATIQHFKNQKYIRYWQVENEPLDPSGPYVWKISLDLLKKEVAVVRTLDPLRNIVINVWGNQLTKRTLYPPLLSIADIIGIDLYPRIAGKLGFKGPSDSDEQLKKIFVDIRAAGKQVWISELQAEPWGKQESCLPQHIKKNTIWAQQFNPDGLFYWGYEYWYRQKLKGDNSYWNAVHMLPP